MADKSKGLKFRRLVWTLLLFLMKGQGRNALHVGRIKAARCYVKGVQSARRAAIGYGGLCALRFTLGFGVFLLHAGLVLYLPWDLRSKGLLLLVLGGIYTLVAAIIVTVLLSQQMWMKATRADQAVRKAVEQTPGR